MRSAQLMTNNGGTYRQYILRLPLPVLEKIKNIVIRKNIIFQAARTSGLGGVTIYKLDGRYFVRLYKDNKGDGKGCLEMVNPRIEAVYKNKTSFSEEKYKFRVYYGQYGQNKSIEFKISGLKYGELKVLLNGGDCMPCEEKFFKWG